MITAAIHGFILAFPLIIPLGVQNVFIFNQGATHKKFTDALPVIITAAICDTILIAMAVMGVSVVVFGSDIIRTLLILVGGAFMVYMGWTTWKSEPNEVNSNQQKIISLRKQIIFTASLSLLNPHAIMDTIGVIGTSSLTYQGIDKVAFAVATIVVSWLWFFSLALVGRVAGQMNNNGNLIRNINKASALIMWGVAFYLLKSNI